MADAMTNKSDAVTDLPDMEALTITAKPVAFTDLPDEIILAIGTFIPHPPDVLNFTRACQRLHRLTIPLLYENITLDYELYSTSSHNTVDKRRIGIGQPQPAIRTLVARLEEDARSDTPRLCPAIRSLKLRVPTNIAHLCLGLWCLLENMTSLEELRFESLERDYAIVDLPPCTCVDPNGIKCADMPHVRSGIALAPDEVNVVLRPTRTSLKILTMFADKNGWQPRSGMSMGDFSHMQTLEFLDIQGKVFLGNDELRDKRGEFVTELNQRLPPKLKVLQLRCYSWDVAISNPDRERSMADQSLEETRKVVQLLKRYLEQAELHQQDLGKVAIWLPEPHRGKEWIEEMRKVTPAVEDITQIALSHGVEIITRTVDDTHWGFSEYPGESDAGSEILMACDGTESDDEGSDNAESEDDEGSANEGAKDNDSDDEKAAGGKSGDANSDDEAFNDSDSYDAESQPKESERLESSDKAISDGVERNNGETGDANPDDQIAKDPAPGDTRSDGSRPQESDSESEGSADGASNNEVSSDNHSHDGHSHNTHSHSGKSDDSEWGDGGSDDEDGEEAASEPWQCQSCLRLGRTFRQAGLSHIHR